MVEGVQGAVLHTGDFRAEPWFLDGIRRNPFLQPYLALPEANEDVVLEWRTGNCSGLPLFKRLDAIYLDTEYLLFMNEVPTKVTLSTMHIRVIPIVGLSLGRCNSRFSLVNIPFPA